MAASEPTLPGPPPGSNPIHSVSATSSMNPSWRTSAACQGLDPEIFYPLSDEDADQAKSVCHRCPVQTSCLEHALGVREKEGIWGGCTERERRRIIRQRRRTA